MKKRLTAFLLAIVIVFCCLFVGCSFNLGNNTGAETPKTDEEKITATVNKFADEYNDGNFEGVLECMEPKIRNTMRALFNILGGIAGGKLGVDINLADLFSLGVGINDGDFIHFEIQDIAIGDGKASVTAFMNLAPATAETMYIILVEEDGKWLIADITDKKSSIGSGENILVKSFDTDGFIDGLLSITYEQEGTTYLGVMNTDGEIVYKREGSLSGWNHIGNGMGWINVYNEETGASEQWIINAQGEVIATSTELGFENIVGGVNGCVWVYKYQSGINGAKHLYNCVDGEGNYKGDWFDLQIPNDIWNTTYRIISDDIIIAEYGWDTAMLNLHTQEIVWLRDTYIQGVYKGDIYGKDGTYHTDKDEAWDCVNGTDFPKYYRIKPDGTIENLYNEAYEDVFTYGDFTNGKLVYEYNEYDDETGTETDYILIYDLERETVATYTDYPTDMVYKVEFVGDYGLVKIKGLDYKEYFTVIDENGVQQFEPIMYYGVQFAGDRIIYNTEYNGMCMVVDAQGKLIVPESAGYNYIGKYSDGLTVARIAETEKWVVLDMQGNVVLDSFYVNK